MTSKVRLTRFEVRGFRSCRDTVLRPKPSLTALIGVNGSGKTNLLQALLLLRRIARGGHPRDPRVATTECEVHADFDVNGKQILYKALLLLSSESGAREEVQAARELWNFKAISGSSRWVDLPSRFLRDPYYRVTANRAAHRGFKGVPFEYRWRSPGRFTNVRLGHAALQSLKSISAFCLSITYYSASRFTNPATCPSSFEVDADGRLRESYTAPQHQEFLHDLYRCSVADPGLYKAYESIVGKRGIGLIDRIVWRNIKAASREVSVKAGGRVVRQRRERQIVIPTIIVKGVRLTPGQLSEGTFRSLALIYNLISTKSHLLLIEEPEVCVHYGLLSSIIEVIKSCAARQQVIFSTHSDFVLDSLDPDNVFLVRYSPRAGTTVSQLADTMSAPHFSSLKRYLRESGNLGEYWRHRGFR
jgi:ABC-type lipoprotein export system ATPase subunit